MPHVLCYWATRGAGQPIRLLLNYVGEEFEDKQYEVGPGPEFSKACWFEEKFTLGLDFPNLPYYIDGDVKLTQSHAICRYIARKHGLLGKSEKEQMRVDLMAEQALDFRNGLSRLCYNPEYEALRPAYLQALPDTLKHFEAFLGKNPWFAGDNISFVDFVMYELLDHHKHLHPPCLEGCPKLRALLQRFEALPAIKAYMASDKFMKAPLNNKAAKFGNK